MKILWKGFAAVFGGFLIHLTLGTFYTFGNMSPYISSYLRYFLKVDVRSSDNTWIFALSMVGQGSVMVFGGIIEKKIGPKLTCLLGGWIMSLGTGITYFSIKHSLMSCVMSYGLLVGFGTGIAYAVAIASAISWFPNRKGLVGGIVVAGFGGGSLIFDQVQTAYINPQNWSPNLTITANNITEKFFGQAILLERVPNCFFILGVVYAVMQFIGALLLSRPNVQEREEREELVHSDDEQIDGKHPSSEEVSTYQKQAEDVSESQETSLTFSVIVKRLVNRIEFWILWGTFLFNFQAIVYINTQYKAFAETFIGSDYFLAVAGSLAGIFNACGRVVWGQLVDYIAYKWLMIGLTSLMLLLMLTLRLAQTFDSAIFFIIWLCLIFGVFSGSFALLPAVCTTFFGHKNMAIHYGMIFTATAISGIIGAFTATLVMGAIGFMGIFSLGAGFSLVSLVLTLVLPKPIAESKSFHF